MKPDYGIRAYTVQQTLLHTDLMKVMKMKKHRKIPADDCAVVFARMYSGYALSQLLLEGRIAIKDKSLKMRT